MQTLMYRFAISSVIVIGRGFNFPHAGNERVL